MSILLFFFSKSTCYTRNKYSNFPQLNVLLVILVRSEVIYTLIKWKTQLTINFYCIILIPILSLSKHSTGEQDTRLWGLPLFLSPLSIGHIRRQITWSKFASTAKDSFVSSHQFQINVEPIALQGTSTFHCRFSIHEEKMVPRKW